MRLSRLLLVVVAMALSIGFFAADARLASAQNCGPSVTHVVQPGENLFRISLNHGTHYTIVAAANGIANPTRIYPGQVLVIPCVGQWAGSTYTGTGATTQVIVPAPPPPNSSTLIVPVIAPVVDCTGFRATHPRDGFTFATQDFYWDAAPGATSYRVLVYNADLRPGTLVAVADVPGPVTRANLAFGVASIGQGFRFSYRIQALVADTVVCSTPLLTLFRQVPPG